MEPYTYQEITQMRTAFFSIEAAYILMDEGTFRSETIEHRRINKTLVEELQKELPDHEKIYYLLNAINNVQNGKQQTTAPAPPEEEPQNHPAKGIKRWFQKISKKRD